MIRLLRRSKGWSFCFFLLLVGGALWGVAQGESQNQRMLSAPVPSQPVLQSLFDKIQSVYISSEKPTVLIGMWDLNHKEILSTKDLAVVDYNEGLDFRRVALSPRKDKIVFSVHGGMRDMLGILELETGFLKKVFEVFGGGVGEPVWAPNGEFVSTTLEFASGLRGIDIVNITSGHRPLINRLMSEFHNKGLETYNAKWSDDSSQLFFSSKSLENGTENKWVIKTDGTGLVHLQ